MKIPTCLGLVMAPAMIFLGALPTRALGEAAVAPAVSEAPAPVDAPIQARATVAQFMQGASVFIENDGQWADPEIRFALDGLGANVGLTDVGPKFQLFRKTDVPSFDSGLSDPVKVLKNTSVASEMHSFGLVFDGAAAVAPVGRKLSETTFNYTMGVPENRRENVPSFSAVWYENIYPGVSVEMTARRSGVKYNLHVAPGADWRSIRLRYENIQDLALRADGALDIHVKDGWGTLTDDTPCIYQEVGGTRKTVSGMFRLLDDHSYGFEVTGTYDSALPLVIDPAVDWSTYLGGTGNDEGRAIAVDSAGNVYVTGVTASSGWVKNSDFNGGMYDAYVVKLDAKGAHVWSTYLGEKGDDEGQGIAVDGSDNVYVTGFTDSTGWVSGGADTSQNGGQDGFVVKLSAAGSQLWSTYLGGTGTDRAYAIAVDDVGNAYVTGCTDSPDWIKGGWDISPDGGLDGFVVRLTPAGDVDWSSYFGGADADYGYGIAVDSKGSYACVTGTTYSSGWTSGGWDTTANGAADGFALKFSKSGDDVWSTYLGGPGADQGYGIAVDGGGNSYVTGYTTAGGWVSGGFDTVQNGGWDGYVVQLSPAGAHLWSTYLGGTDTDVGQSIAVDSVFGVYVTGDTLSTGWVSGGWSTTLNGGYDAFVVKLSAAGGLQWSSYLGGTTAELGNGIAAGANGSLYVTGKTNSSGWVVGGWDTTFGGGTYDAFVAKISQAPTGTIKINSDAAGTNSTNVTLSLTWVDRSTAVVTQMRFSDDGAIWSAWEPMAATRAYALPGTDGQKTVRAQCRDALGYVSDQFSDSILLDTVAPTGSIVINGNLSATNSANASLTLAWADGTGSGAVRMRFSNDGSTWSAWEPLAASRPYALPSGDGYKTVRVQYLDAANNRSAAFSDYIRLDTTTPTGAIAINVGAATTTTRSVTLGLSWADGTGAGVVRMRFSDNGSTWTAWLYPTASRAYTLPAGLGYHTVRVQYLDGANNYSPVYNDYIKLVAP